MVNGDTSVATDEVIDNGCPHSPLSINRGEVINSKIFLSTTLRIAYFVLRKGATQYEVRSTHYEALFPGKKAFEL